LILIVRFIKTYCGKSQGKRKTSYLVFILLSVYIKLIKHCWFLWCILQPPPT